MIQLVFYIWITKSLPVLVTESAAQILRNLYPSRGRGSLNEGNIHLLDGNFWTKGISDLAHCSNEARKPAAGDDGQRRRWVKSSDNVAALLGASINDVRKNVGFFDPLPPLSANSRNLPY